MVSSSYLVVTDAVIELSFWIDGSEIPASHCHNVTAKFWAIWSSMTFYIMNVPFMALANVHLPMTFCVCLKTWKLMELMKSWNLSHMDRFWTLGSKQFILQHVFIELWLLLMYVCQLGSQNKWFMILVKFCNYFRLTRSCIGW